MNKKLSYTSAKEVLVSRLQEVMGPTSNLGLHSLRSGGVSAVSNNSNLSERCIKRHGRWRIDSCKNMYIEDSIHKRLSVSLNLGL